jgi:metallophosphoesterase superfamily enzyme
MDGPFSAVPQGHGAASVLGLNGDTKHIWDKTKPAEVEAMRNLFATMRENGYLAFSVRGEKGEKGEQVNEFDPKMERLIFAPQMRGG